MIAQKRVKCSLEMNFLFTEVTVFIIMLCKYFVRTHSTFLHVELYLSCNGKVQILFHACIRIDKISAFLLKKYKLESSF